MDSINKRFIKKSKFQRKLSDQSSECLICERKCKIREGATGFCGTRMNSEGEIYTLIYGCIAAESCNPIEMKPLYNFHPGTKAYTVGSYGCNFSCFWCQNHHISHPKPSVRKKIETCTNYLSPKHLIQKAIESQCEGTSISFNEPTLLLEYALDVFDLAREKSLYNTYVSNGYMTERVAKELIDHGLDAINIDIKGDKELVRKFCGADVEKVWRNAKLFIKNGVHVEITNLLIEDFNTDIQTIKNIAKRIKNELGKDIPTHFTRAFPSYNSDEFGFIKPTSLKKLYRSRLIAKKEGLNVVYIGNI
ncbi:MAG: radical SAM protein [Promethearchaeota archaeon]|nr:MAG: radical SAM protein [Candidatus Lokiarchaeota archaeon]